MKHSSMGDCALCYLLLIIHCSICYCLPPKIVYQMSEAQRRYKDAQCYLNQVNTSDAFDSNSLEYERALHQVDLHAYIIHKIWKEIYFLRHRRSSF